MDEDSRPLGKSWVQRLVPRGRSANNLSGQRGKTIPSTSQSSSQPVFAKRFILTTRHVRSAGQSSLPLTPDSGARGHSSNHPNLHPSPIASDANLGLGTNPTRVAKVERSDPRETNALANKAVTGIKYFSGVVRNIPSAFNKQKPQYVPDMVDPVDSIVAPLNTFNSISAGISDIHPYAKAISNIFTGASQMILDQIDRDDRDNAVHDLLKKLSEVYTFMNEDGRLAQAASMQDLYGKIARQTLECADFIVHYSETKSTWEKLSKNAFEETDALIKSYNDVLDALMQQFRDEADEADCDIDVNVHRFAEDLDFKDMDCVDDAGRDISKCCLPGTREHILSEIQAWIDSTGEDVQRVFWLNGTAGKGKSAIAHTIANRFIERGGPGAFFCFDRKRKEDRRHEKIFTTIARDLADGDHIIRRALASVVHDDHELGHTKDIMRQWRELILGPVRAAAEVVTAPVLIVIDALDESGDASSREQILRVLSDEQKTISPNLRVLITSRPLDDIQEYLHGASHVCSVSMDDTVHVSKESSDRDIQCYISTLLEDVKDLNDGDFHKLAVKSDGMFIWARLACRYIFGRNTMGQDTRKRFETVLAGTEKGTWLLDEMFTSILEDTIPKDEAIPKFRSVMGQIIASLEPLPCITLSTMRQHFPLASDRYQVEEVIRPLGSLITGTTDSQIPVRLLHTSFYDFLTDKTRSNAFFIDLSLSQRNLAFASLGVLKYQLRFNICSLESSYLPNSTIPDLEERVKKSVSAELSHSCRFWGMYVSATSVERLLVEEVKAFFEHDRLLFWLEVVSLLNIIGDAVAILSCMSDWLTDHSEYTSVAEAVKDTRCFLRTFAPTIVRSTPHLYLSALPLSPMGSRIFKEFAAKFPCTPHVVGGHIAHWPQIEKTIYVHPHITAVAISPDRRRIVCGSEDGTIHMLDMETGEILGAPLLGHIGHVWSIAVSPNGRHIVSCSADKTIRVWDAGTGKSLYAPLQGHTGEVSSVAISPDSNRFVSSSADKTIRVWNIETGEAFGAPLEGHTDFVTSVAISPDGHRIVSGSRDKTIRLWDMNTGEALGVPLLGHTGSIESVAISPNYIVSGSFDRAIRVWEAATGKPHGAPFVGHTDGIYAVTISPDGNSIVSGSDDNTIRVWDTQTGKSLGMPLQGPPVSIFRFAVSPDGNHIVSCSDTVQVWNTSTIWVRDADTSENSYALLPRHSDKILSVAISQDGGRIVSGSRDNTIRVWDMYTGKPLGLPFQGHTSSIWSVAISPINGGFIVSGSSDNTIRMWNTATRSLPRTLKGHSHIVRSVTISSDGTRILSGSADHLVHMWDVHTKALHTTLQGHTSWAESVAISPDGNLIVSGSFDKTIRMWDAMTGKTLGPPLQGHTGRVMSVAISLDCKRIVSGSADKTIRVWDVRTDEPSVILLQGHSDEVLSVAISPHDNIIVSGSSDKTIRVWDALTGKALGEPLRGHTDQVRCVAISPDGKRIVSCSDDVTIRVWDLESFIQPQSSESPAILLSSDTRHALCSPSSFLQDFHTPIHLVPNEEGWIVGPDGQLLLWVPASLYPAVHVPNILLVTSHDVLKVDLSHFAHGESWRNCRGHVSL